LCSAESFSSLRINSSAATFFAVGEVPATHCLSSRAGPKMAACRLPERVEELGYVKVAQIFSL
jgi:hypothetical protein